MDDQICEDTRTDMEEVIMHVHGGTSPGVFVFERWLLQRFVRGSFDAMFPQGKKARSSLSSVKYMLIPCQFLFCLFYTEEKLSGR